MCGSCALLANATRAVLGTVSVRRSAVLNTRHSVRSVPGKSAVVYEVARGFGGAGGQRVCDIDKRPK